MADPAEQRTLLVAHGHGSDAAAAAALARALDPNGVATHVTPEGPLPVAGGRAWFENGSAASIRAGAEVIRATLAALPVGPRVVVGWSQGGAASLAALAGRWEDDADDGHGAGDDGPGGSPRLDGLVLLGSFLADAVGLEYDLGRLAGRPVLIQHGAHDEVVPAFFAADLAAALTAAGAVVEHRELPLGHELDEAAVRGAAEWIARRWER